MKPNITTKNVYIKKNLEPLIIEHYQECAGNNSRMKLKKEVGQWELYKEKRKLFLKLGRQVDMEIKKGNGCPQELWGQYLAAKHTFYFVQGALNEEFSKYAT